MSEVPKRRIARLKSGTSFSRSAAVHAVLLFACSVWSLNGSAQELEIFWTQTGGGRLIDWAHIELDGSGNIVVAGTITSPARFAGRDIAVPAGNIQDIFLAKLRPDGSLIWANSSGGTLMDAATDVDVNSSGQILIGGFFRDPFDFFGGTRMNALGHRDVFTALFEADGTPTWVKRGGGLQQDAAGGVTFDNAGNALATGQLRAGGDYDGTRASATFGGSGFVVRQQPSSGNVANLSMFRDSGVWAIEAMPDGGTVIAGEYFGWTDFGTGFPESRRGIADAFVARYDAAGGLIYVNTFGGSVRGGLDSAYGLAAGDDGRVYVTGQFKGEMTLRPDLILTSAEAERDEFGDGFVMCLEPDGAPCWAQRFGGPDADLGIGIDMPGDGSVAVVGAVGSDAQFGARTVAGAGSSDGFLARYDASSGALQSLMMIGGDGRDAIEDVVSDDSGDLYISGHFNNTVRFGDTVATGVEIDLFVSKVIVADSVPEDPFEDDDDPASAVPISSAWTHSHRCPAWLARRLRSDDDQCEGIFANGIEILPDGTRRPPPRAAEQVWSLTVSGRTLTRDGDFYRVDVPDPGHSDWGPDNENIYAGSLPGIDEPLPECGSTVREDIGPSGRDNNVNVNMTGSFRISIVPAEDHTVTGRGVRPDEPILVYRDGIAAPEIVSRDFDVASVTCPRTVHGLDEIVFSIGERATRSDFNMGEYDVELDYVVEITRGVPDWAFEPSRFFNRGFLPGFSSPDPGHPIGVIRNFPALKEFLDNCIADGPGCWEIFNVAWSGEERNFELDIVAAPGMTFRLLDEEQNVLAESAISTSLIRPGNVGFETQSLVAEQLPTGMYFLAVGGAPGTYSLAYDSTAAMPPIEVKPQGFLNFRWLLLVLVIFAVIAIGLVLKRR